MAIPIRISLGDLFAKFNNKDLRKKLYLYKGNGKYEGMFLYGKLQRTSRSGTEVKCTGLYEYPGEVLEFCRSGGTIQESERWRIFFSE